MGVTQYTTPTFTLTFTDQGLDLTTAKNVYVTFKSKNGLLTKTGESLTIAEKSISVALTQKETGMMYIGNVEIQANWTTATGDRACSNIAKYSIDRQLLQRVVE